MKVIKRNGNSEDVKLDKLTQRVKSVSKDLKFIDPIKVAQAAVSGLFDGITTKEVDEYLAKTAKNLATSHYEYSYVSARIMATSLHKHTKSFYQTMKNLYKAGKEAEKTKHSGKRTSATPMSDRFNELVIKYGKELEKYIDSDRDLNFLDYGFATLYSRYLMRIDDVVVETPQYMYMRIALELHQDDIEKVKKLYDRLSLGQGSFGTPTMYNSGTKTPQLSSCFLVCMEDDSIEGIYNTLKEVALISQYAGGVGLSVSNIRGKGAIIGSTGKKGTGLLPMLKNFNSTTNYVDQGGKRKGSAAVYIEPWHVDVEDVHRMMDKEIHEDLRSQGLFCALYINDIFMERLENNEEWSLFSPDEAPGLQDAYGEEFNKLYLKYEEEGRARKTVNARKLIESFTAKMLLHGKIYFVFKDASNAKSNQKNLGTIKSSNLCAEILEYSSKDETAVCNLASIAVCEFVKDGKVDHEGLGATAYDMTIALDAVIDRNFYPTEKTKRSNMKHRPVGLGIQGLADLFMKLDLPFASTKAKEINKQVSETIYYYALKASVDLAKKKGHYETFKGSPASEGLLQFDLWGVKPSDRHDWDKLKKDIIKHGLRNSLLTAYMPTASTSHILGNFEAFEPQRANIYKKEVLKDAFVVVNRYLVDKLVELGLWSNEMAVKISVEHEGSIQNIDSIPEDVKDIFKTVWEIKMKDHIDMCADRGAFIDQSQSMNLYMSEPSVAKLSSALMYGWKKGLKTGSYYTASRAAMQAAVVSSGAEKMSKEEEIEATICSLDNPGACDSCGA